MNDYLAKPVDRRELTRVVERLLPRPPQRARHGTLDAIERMRDELGPDLALDVLTAFERELMQRLARMGADQPIDRVGREAHALKSAALTFGAPGLGDAARALEQSCSQGLEAEGRERRPL